MCEVIVITSGKGGVGKTTTTANLGSGLAALGKKVVMIDTDLGLRNLDLLLGLENRIVYTIVDVVEKRCKLKQALVKDKKNPNLCLLAAAQTRDKSAVTQEQLVEICEELKQEFDFSVQVEKDKLFLFANNGCAYLYFKEYLIREVFVRTSFVKLCLTPENSMCYSTSPLSEKTFVDYLKEGGKKIELKEMFASGTHEHQGTALPYRIYFPSNYSPDRKYPIFLNLHGAGIRGSDNQRQLNWIGKMLEEEELALDEAILVFPQCPSDQKWVDIPFGSESYSLDAVPEANELACVVDLIRSLCDRYSVDMGRIYACGFSMGGHATWNLLMNHSDLFCAGIAMCGSGDPTKAQLLKDVPIWAIHGTKDPTVPVTGSRNMVEAILAAGGEKIRYTELPDNQHDVWTYTYQNLEIFRWLLSQNRNQS